MSEKPSPLALFLGPPCDCGRPAVRKCSDIDPAGITLPRCQKPLCNSTSHGGWCDEHRHEEGTMGWPNNSRVSFDYEGEDATGEGFVAHLRAWYRNTFWSPVRKATYAWERLVATQFKPPRPIPSNVRVRVKGFVYELRGGQMVKLDEASADHWHGPFQ